MPNTPTSSVYRPAPEVMPQTANPVNNPCLTLISPLSEAGSILDSCQEPPKQDSIFALDAAAREGSW